MNNVLIVLAQSLEQPRIVKRINQKAKEYERFMFMVLNETYILFRTIKF